MAIDANNPQVTSETTDLTRLIAQRLFENSQKSTMNANEPYAYLKQAGERFGGTIGTGLLLAQTNKDALARKAAATGESSDPWNTTVNGPSMFDKLSNLFSGWGS